MAALSRNTRAFVQIRPGPESELDRNSHCTVRSDGSTNVQGSVCLRKVGSNAGIVAVIQPTGVSRTAMCGCL